MVREDSICLLARHLVCGGESGLAVGRGILVWKNYSLELGWSEQKLVRKKQQQQQQQDT